MDGKGQIHVYTGDGKGKTSAAAGLCARALGVGMKVLFLQFIKDGSSSELKALRAASPNFSCKAYGLGRFVKEPSREDTAAARKGLKEAAAALKSGEWGLIVLDEVNCAAAAGLIAVEELLAALEARHHGVEVVLTGRHADPRLIEAAGLVTEMRCGKHYFQKGRKAKLGIEF